MHEVRDLQDAVDFISGFPDAMAVVVSERDEAVSRADSLADKMTEAGEMLLSLAYRQQKSKARVKELEENFAASERQRCELETECDRWSATTRRLASEAGIENPDCLEPDEV